MNDFSTKRVFDRVVRGAEKWEVRLAILPNKLRILGQINPLRATACLQLNIYREPAHFYDLDCMHLLEHLMIRGDAGVRLRANKPERLSYSRELDEAGSGGAWTFENSICLGLQCAPNQVSSMLPLLCRASRAKSISSSLFKSERKRVSAELSDEYSSPAALAHMHWLKQIFPRSPYSRPLGGLPSHMSKIALEELLALRDEILVGSQIVCGVSGNIDFDRAVQLISRELSSLPVENTGYEPAPSPKTCPGINLLNRKSSGLTAFIIGQRIKKNGDPAVSKRTRVRRVELEGIVSAIVTALLGQLWNSKTHSEGHRLGYYDISTGGESYTNAETLWLRGMTEDPETINQVLSLYMQEMTRLRRHGPTREELSRVIRNLRASTMVEAESPKRRTINGCSAIYNDGEYASYSEYLTNLRRINRAMVRDWVQHNLAPASSRLTIVGNTIGFRPRRSVEKFCGL